MESQAQPNLAAAGLADLKTEYEQKAQQVLEELVAKNQLGRLDIFTLLKTITKRMHMETIPNKKILSARGLSPELSIFSEALQTYEHLKSQIKKALRSQPLKICLQKSAQSEKCDEAYLKLRESCKQVRHSIIAKLHVYEVGLIKDFVVLECLTRLVQIGQQEQKPKAIIKSMTLIWQLLTNCQLTQRFLGYKHVNEIVDRLCAACEMNSEAKGTLSNQAPRKGQTRRSDSDQQSKGTQSFERPHDLGNSEENQAKQEGRFRTRAHRLGEFSSPQQRSPAQQSRFVERSKSSHLNLNLADKGRTEPIIESEVSLSSRRGSNRKQIEGAEVDSPPKRTARLAEPSAHHQGSHPAKNPSFKSPERSRPDEGRNTQSGQRHFQQTAAALAGVDATFLSEVSGSSISFRDFPSGSKKSPRIIKDSAVKQFNSKKSAKLSLLEASESLLKQLGQDHDQEAFLAPTQEMIPQSLRFAEETVADRLQSGLPLFLEGDQANFQMSGLAGENANSRTDSYRQSPAVVRVPAFESMFEEPVAQTHLQERRPGTLITRLSFEEGHVDEQSGKETSDWRYPKEESRLVEATRLLNQMAEENKPQSQLVAIDRVVRDNTVSCLVEELWSIVGLGRAQSTAEILEAQIFSQYWNDQWHYDSTFEIVHHCLKYCKTDPPFVLKLVEVMFHLEDLLAMWNEILSNRYEIPVFEGLGKRFRPIDLVEPAVNPQLRLSAEHPWENWNEAEPGELFESFDTRRLNLRFPMQGSELMNTPPSKRASDSRLHKKAG